MEHTPAWMFSALGESNEYQNLLRRYSDGFYYCGARTSNQTIQWLVGRNRHHDGTNVGVVVWHDRPRGIGRMGISRASKGRLIGSINRFVIRQTMSD